MFRQSAATLKGLERYYQEAYVRPDEDHPVIWQQGSTMLRSYAAAGEEHKAIVLLIPSLINKHTIFDLHAQHSFTNHLNNHGYAPYVIDWGEPGPSEQGYDCLHYITRRMCPALDTLAQQHPNTPIYVLGYCLGGILALGLTQLRKDKIHGVALLATPWDYEAKDTPAIPLSPELRSQLEALIKGQQTMPAAAVQSVFNLLYPWKTLEKFQHFAALKDSDAAQHFLSVEQWVNDGIPLTRDVAYECFIKWPQDNSLAKGEWPDRRQPLAAELVDTPSLCVIPEDDKIVPYECAMGLFKALPNATLHTPSLGHVGLLAGRKAPKQCWYKIVEWFDRQL